MEGSLLYRFNIVSSTVANMRWKARFSQYQTIPSSKEIVMPSESFEEIQFSILLNAGHYLSKRFYYTDLFLRSGQVAYISNAFGSTNSNSVGAYILMSNSTYKLYVAEANVDTTTSCKYNYIYR